LINVSSKDLLLVGKVIRPQGLKGLLRIRSFAGSAESFLNVGTVFLKSDKEELLEYKVSSVKAHKGVFLMKLDGLSSLEDAERYRGAEILIKKGLLRRESGEEYFWFELIGLKVYLSSGRYIGTLRDIIATGSNDIYVVKEGETEYLIPAIYEVVEEINLKDKKIIISEMEGLLNLNEV
jgi:16S rRNA processing protein RimM